MLKQQYDERQMQRRNKLGYQTLLLLIVLLMGDVLAYNMGFRWVEYPTNILVIVSICSCVFLIRSAIYEVLVAPNTNVKNNASLTIAMMGITMAIIAFIDQFFGSYIHSTSTYASQLALTIISVLSYICILITIIICFFKRYKENKQEE